jgi:histidine triad (HIT) family protein
LITSQLSDDFTTEAKETGEAPATGMGVKKPVNRIMTVMTAALWIALEAGKVTRSTLQWHISSTSSRTNESDYPPMENCVFCRIVAGKAPASVVSEDKKIMALMTIAPANPGHVLVITKKHFPALASMEDKIGLYLFKITMRVADAIRMSGLRCEGINLFLADGEPQQDILHLHMHVIPRFRGDNFRIPADHSPGPSRKDLDKTAGKVRGAYQRLWKPKRHNVKV